MEVKTYRASSMSEALSLVRHELGPDAAVLHTKEMQVGRLFGLLPGRRVVEVTASTSVNVPSRLSAQREPADDDDRRRIAQAVESTRFASRRYNDATGQADDDGISLSGEFPSRPSSPQATTPVGPSPEFRDLRAAGTGMDLSDAMHGQLRELRDMVKDLCLQSRDDSYRDLPDGLFRVFTELLDADIPEQIARELVEQVRDRDADDMLEPMLLKARIARLLEAEMHCSGPIQVTPGRSRIVALVGPTGVGKTTTIAKLAANHRLKERQRVGLITVDTYRIAAVEQLRTYADIIDLPMQVVSTPQEMRDAVRKLDDLDLILMDTAGRSPKDEVKIQELKAFLDEARADEVHLVLSTTAGVRTLCQTARQFAPIGTTSLLLTKLDESPGLGGTLPLLRQCGLPVSYLTDGQNVPDDIETAEPNRMAQLVLSSSCDAELAS